MTHYWRDDRFPNVRTVTKVGCNNIEKLGDWCKQFNLDAAYIHRRDQYPHFDLIGTYQLEVLRKLGLEDHIARFALHEMKK